MEIQNYVTLFNIDSSLTLGLKIFNSFTGFWFFIVIKLGKRGKTTQRRKEIKDGRLHKEMLHFQIYPKECRFYKFRQKDIRISLENSNRNFCVQVSKPFFLFPFHFLQCQIHWIISPPTMFSLSMKLHESISHFFIRHDSEFYLNYDKNFTDKCAVKAQYSSRELLYLVREIKWMGPINVTTHLSIFVPLQTNSE